MRQTSDARAVAPSPATEAVYRDFPLPSSQLEHVLDTTSSSELDVVGEVGSDVGVACLL
ncbi:MULTISPECIES: hypothetical protein [Mycetohabitans]|uniref:hypothetical protein n=1 Tax=Mycetohabitans TaxID=2571159 RepID=UPI00095E841D|nr:hypothetical protein [Mycetohabitans sp. B4]MCG1018458.1 hypothetical protein [Mycetohabitans sp. B4]SIT66177.1 hypothetical protein SAMN04487768_0761 [Burkholderia sp. b13]